MSKKGGLKGRKMEPMPESQRRLIAAFLERKLPQAMLAYAKARQAVSLEGSDYSIKQMLYWSNASAVIRWLYSDLNIGMEGIDRAGSAEGQHS